MDYATYKKTNPLAKKPMKPGDFTQMMKKRKSSVKLSGSFHGKSNKLGHGGRAAQLTNKLRGEHLPGGEREVKAIVGINARKAHAAPGQKNFHGKKAKKAHKAPAPEKQNLGMVMKKSEKSSGQHVHVHVHVHHKGSEKIEGTKRERTEGGKKEFKHYKKAHKNVSEDSAKHGDERDQGVNEEGREEGKKEFKRKGATCMKCKGAHKTSEHKKKASK